MKHVRHFPPRHLERWLLKTENARRERERLWERQLEMLTENLSYLADLSPKLEEAAHLLAVSAQEAESRLADAREDDTEDRLFTSMAAHEAHSHGQHYHEPVKAIHFNEAVKWATAHAKRHTLCYQVSRLESAIKRNRKAQEELSKL